jgi:DNA-binding CsgD family transcriptional regulator
MNTALFQKDIEFFVDENGINRVLTNGETFLFDNAPLFVHNILSKELESDTKAKSAMKELGLSGIDALRKLALCRYGLFSDTPDISGDNREPEYRKCELRGKCPAEGRVCLTLKCAEGHLTSREIEIIALTALDLSDKMIADKLSISELTVRTHMDNIRRKLQVSTRVGIAVFACQKNIT